MIAILGGSAEDAESLYRKAIELGTSCEGAPGQRLPFFYAAYVRDLDGNKVASYHMTPTEVALCDSKKHQLIK